MNETVSVDDAIKKGQRIVNIPVIAIMYSLLGLGVIISTNNLLPAWAVSVVIVLAIGLAWLYWSFAITKWRLWAFENVRNVHELKKRAIAKKLIWPEGNFFEKTEIRSSAQRKRWAELKIKFEVDDIFIEDDAVHPETIISYSYDKALNRSIIGFLITCVSIYIFIFDTTWTGFIFLTIGGYLLITGYLKIKNTKPQIILSNKGIETYKTPFYEWNLITDETVKRIREGKTVKTQFTYNCPAGHQDININSLDIDMDSLENLLYLYRSRFDYARTKK